MSNMQATLRALLGRTASLPALAGHASDLLYASTSPEKYVTAALVDLEPSHRRDHASSAPGTSTTLILRADGDDRVARLHRHAAGPAAAAAAVRRD